MLEWGGAQPQNPIQNTLPPHFHKHIYLDYVDQDLEKKILVKNLQKFRMAYG